MQTDYNNAILNVRQMAEADRLAIESGVPGTQLMENAGQVVVREIKTRFAKCPVAVLCGPGNNGGDGFVVARLLASEGWPVRLGLLGGREKLKGDARHHAGLYKGKVEPLSPALLDDAALVVDALFGAGLARPLEGAALETLAAVEKKKIPMVAVDVPSGVMGDTGESLGAVAAALTVTFFRKKPGHLLLPGKLLCGEVVVADIGIPSATLERIQPQAYENVPDLWIGALPRLRMDAHKYTRGSVLIYGGYPMTGAARLAARGAARAGAGLTTVACPENAFPIYAETLESIIVKPLSSSPGTLDNLLREKKYTAFLIGPGAGVGENTKTMAKTMLSRGMLTVLDADAISAFAGKSSELQKSIVGPCIMTPHEGEFKRVFDFSGDKLSRARAAAQYCNATIVLKGNDTVIAAPDGRAVINANAPATLATGGSGDVLGGIILGLGAQDMPPFLAACAGVWMHSQAAADFRHGLIAEDIPDMLPGVFKKLFG